MAVHRQLIQRKDLRCIEIHLDYFPTKAETFPLEFEENKILESMEN